jgi:hypothetical protein
VNALDHLARRSRLIALALLSLSIALLLLRFRQGTSEALEIPMLANVVAISAGLVLASFILVGLRRRTAARAERSSYD